MRYQFSPEARLDLVAAADYYNSRSEGLGAEFNVDFGLALAKVLDSPTTWPEIEPGFRKCNLDRFPYAVVYRSPHRQLVEIVAAFDLRRRPGSWRRS